MFGIIKQIWTGLICAIVQNICPWEFRWTTIFLSLQLREIFVKPNSFRHMFYTITHITTPYLYNIFTLIVLIYFILTFWIKISPEHYDKLRSGMISIEAIAWWTFHDVALPVCDVIIDCVCFWVGLAVWDAITLTDSLHDTKGWTSEL